MKGIFDAYVLWPFDKKLFFEFVTRVNARDFTVYGFLKPNYFKKKNSSSSFYLTKNFAFLK